MDANNSEREKFDNELEEIIKKEKIINNRLHRNAKVEKSKSQMENIRNISIENREMKLDES